MHYVICMLVLNTVIADWEVRQIIRLHGTFCMYIYNRVDRLNK